MPKTIKSHKGSNNGNYKHGGKGTKLYEIWCAMRSRCSCPKSKSYKHYGGRGIAVCKEWDTDFNSFRQWAIENGYKEELSIDRIDVNGNYEPDNCRWATAKQQTNNRTITRKIEYQGKTLALSEWSECLGIKLDTLYYRIFKLGWSIERAFNERVSYDRHNRKLKEGVQG